MAKTTKAASKKSFEEQAGITEGSIFESRNEKGEIVREMAKFDYDENNAVTGWHKEVVPGDAE